MRFSSDTQRAIKNCETHADFYSDTKKVILKIRSCCTTKREQSRMENEEKTHIQRWKVCVIKMSKEWMREQVEED